MSRLQTISKDELMHLTSTVDDPTQQNMVRALLELAEKDPNRPRVCPSCLKTYPEKQKFCVNEFHDLWSGKPT